MTTSKILIKGFGADVTEADVRTLLKRFGPVERVDLIREGSPAELLVLVEMGIDDRAAEYLVLRLGRFCGVSAVVSARLLKP